MHRFITLASCAAALAVLSAAPAAAAPPEKTTSTASFSSVIEKVCSFDINAESTATATVIAISDQSGALVRLQVHVVEQDVFSANGVSLTSTPYNFNQQIVIDPSSGDAVHAWATGRVVTIPLPDGTVFRSAGRLDFVTYGANFALTPQVGLSGDTAALCAALAG